MARYNTCSPSPKMRSCYLRNRAVQWNQRVQGRICALLYKFSGNLKFAIFLWQIVPFCYCFKPNYTFFIKFQKCLFRLKLKKLQRYASISWVCMDPPSSLLQLWECVLAKVNKGCNFENLRYSRLNSLLTSNIFMGYIEYII